MRGSKRASGLQKKPTRARRMLKEGVGGGGWEEGRPMRAGEERPAR